MCYIIIWLCQSKHDFYVFRICYSITSLSVLTDRDHNQYLTKCFLLFSTRSKMSVVSHSLHGTFKIYTYMTSTRTIHSIASTSHQFRLHNMTQWFIVYRIISVFCVKIVWVYCATIFVQSARWAAKHIPNAVICSKSFKSCEWYGLSDESIHCVCVVMDDKHLVEWSKTNNKQKNNNMREQLPRQIVNSFEMKISHWNMMMIAWNRLDLNQQQIFLELTELSITMACLWFGKMIWDGLWLSEWVCKWYLSSEYSDTE